MRNKGVEENKTSSDPVRVADSEKTTLHRIRIYLMLLAIALSGAVLASSCWQWTDALDKLVYDQLLQTRPQDPPADVIVIAIDEYSISHIGEWPWSRRYHAELINQLTDAGVSAIGFDVVFAELNPLDVDGDQMFADAIIRNGNVVLPVYIDRTQLGGQLIEVLPHPAFAEHARMGHVNTQLDNDGIVRQFFQFEGIGEAFWAHFATVVAEISTNYQQPSVKTEGDEAISPLVNVRRMPRLIPFLGGVGSFQQVSFFDVISGKIPPRLFKDRVVFVGATSISLGDLLPTPVTVAGEQMPGVEINATIFEAARHQGFLQIASPIVTAIVCVLFVLSTVFIIPRVAGRTSLIFIVVSSVLLFAIQSLLMLQFKYWIPLASAIIGQWLVYPLWTVLRLDQTTRYLQKQLVSLREELGHQSLVEHHADNEQAFVDKFNNMMSVAGVSDYQLTVDKRVLHSSSSISQLSVLNLTDIQDGPSRVGDNFYCKYDVSGKSYLVVVPIKNVSDWSEEVEAYITGFFENELSIPVTYFEGTYDLVFKYLNEVRTSQNEVNKARLLFEYCVNEMNDGVIIADEFGSVLFVNRLALDYLSLSPEILNEPSRMVLAELLMQLQLKSTDKSWHRVLFSLVSDRGSAEVEVRTPADTALLVNLSYLDVVAHRSNLVVVNLYDITRIREAQRLRNETIDFLSHDMRSPMVSLIALVNQKRSNGESSEFLNQIEQYASKNLYFAEQFLQLARVESGESIQTYEVDFEAIVQNGIDEVYSQAQEKNISLSFVCDDDLYWVKGNGELLERAVVNLLTNAIKYGPSDSTVDIELKPHGASLMLLVRDYGSGIPKEQQPNLFASYQRANEKPRGQPKGAGLGLRFVDVTIKRHHGELFFNSHPGRTEFGFILPTISIE